MTRPGKRRFKRARVLASRKAGKALTEGQTLEAVVDHYLEKFDLLEASEGRRRVPDTAEVDSRYVPADVRRAVRRRDDDRCAVEGCECRVFLQFAHLVPHAMGGDRERKTLVRLCYRHHRWFDAGSLRLVGTAEEPRFLVVKEREPP